MKPRNRKLIVESNETHNTHEPNLTNSTKSPSPPLLEPISDATVKQPIDRNAPFDSSMALTVLALLIALFFMGLFSVYIRRFSSSSSSSVVDISRRRQNNSNNNNSSSSPPWRPSTVLNKGVDPSTVPSLPVYYYHHGDASTNAKHQTNDCAVCLSGFEEREEIKMIPFCRHVFHPYCIDRWLLSHVSCPLCRTTHFFPAKDDDRTEMMQLEVRSTVEIGDTWTSDVRRTSSCSSIGGRVSLQRTSSF